MPKVGKKHYAYTKEGKAKAKADAKKLGVSVKYDEGGEVKKEDEKELLYSGPSGTVVKKNVTQDANGLFEGSVLLEFDDGTFYEASAKSKDMQFALDQARFKANALKIDHPGDSVKVENVEKWGEPEKPKLGEKIKSFLGLEEGGEVEYGDNTELKDVGGVATGGQGGVDDINAMLTEGEVVLNEDQQNAIGEITGIPAEEVFAAAEVPGFEDNKYHEGGQIPEHAHQSDNTVHPTTEEYYEQMEEERIQREKRIKKEFEKYQKVSKENKKFKEYKEREKEHKLTGKYEAGGKVGGLFDFPSKKSRE